MPLLTDGIWTEITSFIIISMQARWRAGLNYSNYKLSNSAAGHKVEKPEGRGSTGARANSSNQWWIAKLRRGVCQNVLGKKVWGSINSSLIVSGICVQWTLFQSIRISKNRIHLSSCWWKGVWGKLVANISNTGGGEVTSKQTTRTEVPPALLWEEEVRWKPGKEEPVGEKEERGIIIKRSMRWWWHGRRAIGSGEERTKEQERPGSGSSLEVSKAEF